MEDRRLLLMCQEHAPGDCHRFRQVAVPLLTKGIDVLHIYEEQFVTTAALKAAIEDADPDAEPEMVPLQAPYVVAGDPPAGTSVE